MKKVVGVMPLWDDTKESLWMLPGYLEGIKDAGGLPIIFSLTTDSSDIEQMCDTCNGILFTGGHDVCPELYGEDPMPGLDETCKMRDIMEKIVLDYALKKDIAVFGICRGIQFINVALGGTLYQDLPTQRPSNIDHHMRAPYDRTSHTVIVKKQSDLYKLLQTESLGVNSYHHQAIKQLAPGLEIMAESEDGLIEAVSMNNKDFVWAVQWHPEFSYKKDINSKKLFSV